MFKKAIIVLSFMLMPAFCFAANVNELLERESDNTTCATPIYQKALDTTVDMLSIGPDGQEQKPESATGSEIDTWIHTTFAIPTVITNVLNCPEIKNKDDDTTIVFDTINYTFPNGRTIKINYETQKSVLKQKLLLAQKKELAPGDVSPDITADAANGIVWVNVDPAWYAIMVTEHGALDEFINENSTNVISAKYIEENIDNLFPQNHGKASQADCTSASAIAGDKDMINRAVTRTVGGGLPRNNLSDAEGKQAKVAENNDYYVYGDANLQWITWGEVAFDVILTVATWGGFEFVKSAITLKRAANIYNKAKNTAKAQRYIRTAGRAAEIERAISKLNKLDDSFDAIKNLDRVSKQHVRTLANEIEALKNTPGKKSKKLLQQIADLEEELAVAEKQATASAKAAETAEQIKEAELLLNNPNATNITRKVNIYEERIQKLQQDLAKTSKKSEADKIKAKIRKYQDRLKKRNKQLEPSQEVTQEIAELKAQYSKDLEDVQKLYKEEMTALEKTAEVKAYNEMDEMIKVSRQGKVASNANRGLLPVRAFRAAKTIRANAKTVNKTAKALRPKLGSTGAKINDWLYHNTQRSLVALSKVPATLSTLQTGIKFVGDMYDYTDTSTGKYTNNIDFKPFLLLGADDLPGFENVVNHGMWLFWAGSSTSAADDDAAFLQAMAFAEKFHQDLVELQDETGITACNVDIFVVRPIIRNPGTESQELYYLIMNNAPWTTYGYNTLNDENGTKSDISDDFDDAPSANYTPMANGGVTGVAGKIKYTEPAYDGTRIGQSCTPPSSSANGFSPAVHKSGRYAKYPAFEKAMITKFRTEGTCGEHPSDPGGYTCYGVSSKFFPQVKKKGFSRNDAEDIAFNSFYKKYKLDKLPDAISGDVFMALWGTGSKSLSIGLLQRLLGVKQTNVVDSATINAAKNYQGNLRTKFLDTRERWFRQTSKKEFRRGWLNAVELYRANGCHTITE